MNTKNSLKAPSLTMAAIFLFFSTVFFTACKKIDHDPPEVDKQLIAEGYVSPLGVVAVPDNSKRLFVIDQVGKIWIIDKNGQKIPNPFIDVSGKLVSLTPGYDERGLLGLAFHPNYSSNGKFYIYYQLPPRAGGPGPGWNNLSRISEFRVSGSNPNVADMSTERILLDLDDPQSNHNGVQLPSVMMDIYTLLLEMAAPQMMLHPGMLKTGIPSMQGGTGRI